MLCLCSKRCISIAHHTIKPYFLQIEPEIWHHLCYSFVNNTIWIILDGKLLVDDLINLPSIQFDLKILKDKGFVLGYRNNPEGKFLGEMTDVNIWSKGLLKVFLHEKICVVQL